MSPINGASSSSSSTRRPPSVIQIDHRCRPPPGVVRLHSNNTPRLSDGFPPRPPVLDATTTTSSEQMHGSQQNAPPEHIIGVSVAIETHQRAFPPRPPTANHCQLRTAGVVDEFLIVPSSQHHQFPPRRTPDDSNTSNSNTSISHRATVGPPRLVSFVPRADFPERGTTPAAASFPH